MPLLLVAILSSLGATTAAAGQNVPPGVSGANQYTETLPGPGGNTTAGGGGGTGGNQSHSPAKTLGAANARKLEALGPEGQAAAELAAESGAVESQPGPSKHQGHRRSRGHKAEKQSSGSGGASTRRAGSSGIQQVLGQITGTGGSNSGGMNWLLPMLIGASVLIAAAYLLNRRRPARPQD
jgi:hypothetical protein